MITLFKNIRKKPPSENQVNQYLAHALDEIFVAVIGIPIALQINNWNEEWSNRQKESLILKNMATRGLFYGAWPPKRNNDYLGSIIAINHLNYLL